MAPKLAISQSRQVVRRPRSAARHRAGGRARRVHLGGRPLGLRQDHVPAHRRRASSRRARARCCSTAAPLHGPGGDRGFVFQSDSLLPWRTVFANAIIGREVAGQVGPAERRRTMELLKLVGLEGFENYHPRQLSGGMRQRVNLARALAIDPEILLMDEPFSSLDAQTREIMQTELMRIWEEGRKTVLFVTHQIDEAVFLSDRVLVFARRPGRLRETVEIELPRPRALAIKRTPRIRALCRSHLAADRGRRARQRDRGKGLIGQSPTWPDRTRKEKMMAKTAEATGQRPLTRRQFRQGPCGCCSPQPARCRRGAPRARSRAIRAGRSASSCRSAPPASPTSRRGSPPRSSATSSGSGSWSRTSRARAASRRRVRCSRSRADGYTIGLVTNGTAISAAMLQGAAVRPGEGVRADLDHRRVSIWCSPANANPRFKTLADFIKAAREQPGKLNVGTIAVGGTQNLGAELLKSSAGSNFQIIPYRGTPDVIVALLRNDIQLMVDFYAAMKPTLAEKKIRPVATSGPQRSPFLADVPTVAQAGVAGLRGHVVERRVRSGRNAGRDHQPAQQVDPRGRGDPRIEAALCGARHRGRSQHARAIEGAARRATSGNGRR